MKDDCAICGKYDSYIIRINNWTKGCYFLLCQNCFEKYFLIIKIKLRKPVKEKP